MHADTSSLFFQLLSILVTTAISRTLSDYMYNECQSYHSVMAIYVPRPANPTFRSSPKAQQA